MRRLIRADVRRILKKKGMWVSIIFAFAFRMIFILRDRELGALGGFSFMSNASNMLIFNLFVGVSIHLSVYGDEFRSKTMTTVIGRGLSRTKVVLAKFLDTVILTLLAVLVNGLITVIVMLVFKVHMSPYETKVLVCSHIDTLYVIIGNVTFASAFLFLTENSALAVFVYLALEMVLPSVIVYSRSVLDFVGRYNLDRLDYSALGRMAFSDFALGLTGGAIFKLVLGLVIYVGAFLIATAVIFNRKELDF